MVSWRFTLPALVATGCWGIAGIAPPPKCRECSEGPQLGFVNLRVRAKNLNIPETVIRVGVSFYFAHTRTHTSPFCVVHTHGGIARICPFVRLSICSLSLCERVCCLLKKL